MEVLGRNKAFKLLGVKPTNPRWSWCAVAEDGSRAVFTLWEDEIIGGTNRLLWDDYNPTHRHGENDQKQILDRVMKEGIPAYGLICVAHDPKAEPRELKEAKVEFLIELLIKRQGADVVGVHRRKLRFAELALSSTSVKVLGSNGLDDLLAPPAGCLAPDRALQSGWTVKRDAKVRAYVIRHAAGKCEYCGKQGFLMKNGSYYLEAHHIIALACKGPDTVHNVIALCPDHHREAHFGANAEELEAKFLAKLARIRR